MEMESEGGCPMKVKESLEEFIEKGLVISYDQLLRLNSNLIQINNFSGKTIKETRRISDFEFFGVSKHYEQPVFVLIFADGSISVPLAALRNLSATQASYDRLIEAGLLRPEHKEKAIPRLKKIYSLQAELEKHEDNRCLLQKELKNHGLGRKRTQAIWKEIDIEEKAIQSFTKEINELQNALP